LKTKPSEKSTWKQVASRDSVDHTASQDSLEVQKEGNREELEITAVNTKKKDRYETK
jgi:hypothetical protein